MPKYFMNVLRNIRPTTGTVSAAEIVAQAMGGNTVNFR